MVWTAPKTFTAGERLFAQDLNTYVSDNLSDLDPRTVKSFADASARTAAIPSPVAGAVTFLEDTDAVEVYDGSAWVAVGSDPNPGIGTAVVTASQGTAVTIATSTYTDTNLSATITPTSATSKVLVIVSQSYYVTRTSGVAPARFRILRDTTEIATDLMVGLAAADGGAPLRLAGVFNTTYLDSPATTSAVTYSTQARRRFATGTVYVNADIEALDSMSYITLIEVAA